MMNNKFDIKLTFDSGNCPLQKDEEWKIREMFINLSSSLNLMGIKLEDIQIDKYGN